MRVRPWHVQDLTAAKARSHGIDLLVCCRPDFADAQSGLQGDMQTRDVITEKLRDAFAPESLHVEDESHKHEGHAGHRPGGETHFRLYIVSEAFRGKSRIERHRMINATLAGELAGSVHALAIHAAAPGEDR
jgi:BolA family transcriptional regulator, general stress-responsive regulator